MCKTHDEKLEKTNIDTWKKRNNRGNKNCEIKIKTDQLEKTNYTFLGKLEGKTIKQEKKKSTSDKRGNFRKISFTVEILSTE